jgi:NADH:ubiquinone oxidoreductase subunit
MARPIFGTVLSAASMLVLTRVRGTYVGADQRGNKYYRGKPVHTQTHERRWVLYAGEPEATLVPPEWHSWLHHLTKDPPQPENDRRQPWQKPPLPNLTGTDLAYRPPGSTLNAGYRDRATGDYESWTPPQ